MLFVLFFVSHDNIQVLLLQEFPYFTAANSYSDLPIIFFDHGIHIKLLPYIFSIYSSQKGKSVIS